MLSHSNVRVGTSTWSLTIRYGGNVFWEHLSGTTLMQSADFSEWFPAKGVMLEDGGFQR